nr:immunoglobulin heavy chain junction region [Macaca mulatta]MOX63780.1 immunoglobulin heavy chain junction region [Macaca mulatta]MOX66126.1 immunoglobulin heavy chain junction region [Macaca mulatta]MOX68038.1 immunoglobulin heavy chain junction region [Macaca mulatta]
CARDVYGRGFDYW